MYSQQILPPLQSPGILDGAAQRAAAGEEKRRYLLISSISPATPAERQQPHIQECTSSSLAYVPTPEATNKQLLGPVERTFTQAELRLSA